MNEELIDIGNRQGWYYDVSTDKDIQYDISK